MSHVFMSALATPGHANPMIAVAEELVRNGHRVTFSITDCFRDAVVSAGAMHVPYDSAMGQDAGAVTRACVRPAFAYTEFLKDTLQLVPKMIDQIDRYGPDLVVYDRMCMAARWAAELTDTAKVSLNPTHAQNRQFLMNAHPAAASQAVAPDPVTALVVEAEYAGICQQFRQRLGVNLIPFDEAVQRADPLNLVCIPRAFQVQGDTFDERFAFVGPCLGRRAGESPVPPVGAGRRRILVTRGSILTDAPDFYRFMLRALDNPDWDVHMAVGAGTRIEDLGRIPDNFTLAARLPQLSILDSADAFICAGGMNSIMESLDCCVPLLILPETPEQRINASQVRALGLGMSLDLACRDEVAVRECVNQLIHAPGFRASLLWMQRELREAGGVRAAAAAIATHLETLASGRVEAAV